MVGLKLMVLNDRNEQLCSKQGEDEVTLVYCNQYQPGDKIVVKSDTKGVYLKLRLDDSVDESWVYLNDYQYQFIVPFDEARKPYGKKAFSEQRHFLYATTIEQEELGNYRNVAKNSFDTNQNDVIYPHASSNVITDIPQFFSRNAIDGIIETGGHGNWPYSSWGINKQSDAWLKIDFGQKVEIDRIHIYLRADFPHDNWWKQARLTFSDGSSMIVELIKTGYRQEIILEPRMVSWVKLSDLIMSDEESQFPALSQIMIFGKNII